MNCTGWMAVMGLAVGCVGRAAVAQGPATASPVSPPARAPGPPALTIVAGTDAKPFMQEVPGAAYKFEMLPIPASLEKNIKPFWIGKTEITWEAFDVYVYRLDEPAPPPVEVKDATGGGSAASPPTSPMPPGADAVTRPSKPYLPPDRGFGHEGYAAIGMSLHNAREFCKWLSAKSGRKYRLPTEVEWEHACLAGGKGPYAFGEDAAKVGEFAWTAENAGDSPHAVGKKKANAWGLVDVHGNVGEWCETADGKGVLKGGSFQDAADAAKAGAREVQSSAWNASDPQVPKSKWWLANGPFVGFRVVCEAAEVKTEKGAGGGR